ncbi:hypothetical protein PO909_023693 [Leuciscus waleckii]
MLRGPRWKGAWFDPLFLLLLALQLLVVAGLVRAQTCPSVCSCSNQFSKVICTRRGLKDVPDGISTNTRYLNLQDNQIQVIKVDSFKHLRHLEILQLSRNHIRNIEIGAFNGLTSLNTLELFDNRLTTIPNGAFEYLSKLKELWLRNNPIESIPSDAFSRLPSLRRLDLGELKRLSYISSGAFQGLIHLHHNPWNCNCDILWLSWWLRETVPTNTSCCARCNSPPSLKGRYIGDGFSYFTTVTVETIETPIDGESRTPVQPSFGWASSSTTRGTPIATERAYTIPVMKTTKIIIGCFVAITLMAAVMLIIFYKMRKQHHQQDHDGPTRSIEIINVHEELTRVPAMESHLTLPPLEHEHYNHYNSYKTAYNHVSALSSLHSSVHEPLLIQASSKDNVQETQI